MSSKSLLDGNLETDCAEEDIDYARDLRLFVRYGPLQIANPIYRELVPRQLACPPQRRLRSGFRPQSCLKVGGSLDLPCLLRRFQSSFRGPSEHWVRRFGYLEAGPQLILQAF